MEGFGGSELRASPEPCAAPVLRALSVGTGEAVACGWTVTPGGLVACGRAVVCSGAGACEGFAVPQPAAKTAAPSVMTGMASAAFTAARQGQLDRT